MSFLFSGGLFSVFVWLIVALICQAIRASPIPRYCSKEETVKRMRGQVEIEKEFAQRLAERNARIATSKKP
jgi:5-methylcytosine-specific restriction endonuclease McrBC regulatory subunit McrC